MTDPASAQEEAQDTLEDLPVESRPAVEVLVKDPGHFMSQYIHDKGNM